LGFFGCNGRIILKWIILFKDVGVWTEFNWLGVGNRDGLFEHVNVPSGSL
jgi:hypothetical protein